MQKQKGKQRERERERESALRRSKESDTQFAKCDKLNEKCENEEESSVPDRKAQGKVKQGRAGRRAGRRSGSRKVA